MARADQIRNFGIAFRSVVRRRQRQAAMVDATRASVYLIGVGLLIATEISGETVEGRDALARIKVTRIQPSEIMTMGCR